MKVGSEATRGFVEVIPTSCGQEDLEEQNVSEIGASDIAVYDTNLYIEYGALRMTENAGGIGHPQPFLRYRRVGDNVT
jgi:hypothetical protein